MKIKRELFKFIVFKIAKYDEACYLPKWVRVLRCVLFPYEMFMLFHVKDFGYNFSKDIVYIYGYKYSVELFRHIAYDKLGACLKIIDRGDGMITCKSIKEAE
ncbi:MAG: hypothetical protein PHX80_03685 [Candidatus Nanoarchaeia archaeon]|nr:hypothetical protein [Candidatus Nanoarchaeia archaeon]